MSTPKRRITHKRGSKGSELATRMTKVRKGAKQSKDIREDRSVMQRKSIGAHKR